MGSAPETSDPGEEAAEWAILILGVESSLSEDRRPMKAELTLSKWESGEEGPVEKTIDVRVLRN